MDRGAFIEPGSNQLEDFCSAKRVTPVGPKKYPFGATSPCGFQADFSPWIHGNFIYSTIDTKSEAIHYLGCLRTSYACCFFQPICNSMPPEKAKHSATAFGSIRYFDTPKDVEARKRARACKNAC